MSIALGRYSNPYKDLPVAKTKLIQRAIGLFFSVCRRMDYVETTEGQVKVATCI